ncbi:MAG: group II intron maturase-specific domain-containing protein [Verrucomicrobiales bacterium]
MPLAEAGFLGFRILRKKIRWTDKSRKKLMAKVRELTGRTRGVSPGKVIAGLQTYLRAAINYDACGIPYGEVRELDGWLRRRMRLYYWTAKRGAPHQSGARPQSGEAEKQWGRPRTRRRRLISLGIDRRVVQKASRSRKGHWRMSQN